MSVSAPAARPTVGPGTAALRGAAAAFALLAAFWAPLPAARWREGGVFVPCFSVFELALGLLATLVLRRLLREDEVAGKLAPPSDEIVPQEQWAIEKAKALRSAAPPPPPAPAPWWACCFARGDDDDVVPAASKDGQAGRCPTPWVSEPDSMHPKFCGLRLDEPTQSLPPLQRFAKEPMERTAAPASFEALLPCTDEERRLCRELRQRIAEVPGAKDPVTMLRFLRARQRRVDAAAEMYRKAMAWRQGNGLERGFRLNTVDDSLHRRLDAFWPPTGLMGFDRDGDAVYWNRMSLCDMDFLAAVPAEFLGRHEVYCVTRILQALEEYSLRSGTPRFGMTVVVDLAGLSFGKLNLKAAPKYQHVVRIMEDNFPELVKRIVVVRAPRVASALWKVISKFFDEGTRSKIQIVDEAATMETLRQFIDPKWVPAALGGRCETRGGRWCEPALPGRERPVPRALVQEILAAAATDGFVGC